MFRLLSDLEVALNEVLVACRESVYHFRDAAELITTENVARELDKLANQRETFIPVLEREIRNLGDLPSMPDPDKENSAMLLRHLGAAMAQDYTSTLLQQRIEAEQHLIELINQARESDTEGTCKTLLDDLALQTNNSIEQLRELAGC